MLPTTEEEEEADALRRARARNVNKISKSTIKERVLDPSRRYAAMRINEARERFNETGSTISPPFNNPANSSTPATPTTTGDGRNTRANVGEQGQQNGGRENRNRTPPLITPTDCKHSLTVCKLKDVLGSAKRIEKNRIDCSI